MPKLIKTKVETGIWYVESKDFYISCYSKRNPHDRNKPMKLERYGMRSLTEARKVRGELVQQVMKKISEFNDPMWQDLVDEALNEMYEDDYGLNTISNYEAGLKGNTNPVWGTKRISKITTSLIRNFFIEGRKRWKPSHTKNMIKYIKKVLDHAIESGYIDRNPMPKIRLKSNSKLKTVLNERQIKTLLQKARDCEHAWYPIWATALLTGMRNGELYALKWEDVSFEQSLINVCSSWNRHDGFKCTKSGDDRYVEISKPLGFILSELKTKNFDTEFVLPRISKWDKGEQARVLRKFLRELDLPEIRFHDTRACWATLMLSKGVVPIKVMKMGGWKDLKTMERYIRQAGVDIKGITACLDDIHEPFPTSGSVLAFSNNKISEKTLL